MKRFMLLILIISLSLFSCQFPANDSNDDSTDTELIDNGEDNSSNPPTEPEPNFRTYKYETYDLDNLLISTTVYSYFNALEISSMTNTNHTTGDYSIYTYEDQINVSGMTYDVNDIATSAFIGDIIYDNDRISEIIFYDIDNQIIRLEEYSYDITGQIVTTHTYTDLNELSNIIIKEYNSDNRLIGQEYYDSDNNLLSVLTFVFTGYNTQSLSVKGYDTQGELVSETNYDNYQYVQNGIPIYYSGTFTNYSTEPSTITEYESIGEFDISEKTNLMEIFTDDELTALTKYYYEEF